MRKIIRYTLLLIRQLRNKLLLFKLFILTFLWSSNTGPHVVIENYGNWKTLSSESKTAYVVGVWDSYMVFFRDEVIEKYGASCNEGSFTRVLDLVEVVDKLYEIEINKSFSPANLLKEKGFIYLCAN